MQGMRWKGDGHSLPECSLTQAEAFSTLDDLRPSVSLKASRRRSPTSRPALDGISGTQYRLRLLREVITAGPGRCLPYLTIAGSRADPAHCARSIQA